MQIDKESILNHRTEIIHKTKNHNKTIGVVHLNIKDKLAKCNQLNQTLPVLKTKNTQNYN